MNKYELEEAVILYLSIEWFKGIAKDSITIDDDSEVDVEVTDVSGDGFLI